MKFEIQTLLISFFLMFVLLKIRFKFAEDIYMFLKFTTTFFVYSVSRDFLINLVQIGDLFWYILRNILPFILAVVAWKAFGSIWLKWSFLKK